MKIFSVAFQSVIQPDKFSMYSVMANSPQEAYEKGVVMLVETQGDLAWKPLMQTVIDVQVVPEKESKIEAVDSKVEIAATKSWMMQTIIDHKDKALYKVGKKYLSKPEQLFIEEKLHAK